MLSNKIKGVANIERNGIGYTLSSGTVLKNGDILEKAIDIANASIFAYDALEEKFDVIYDGEILVQTTDYNKEITYEDGKICIPVKF